MAPPVLKLDDIRLTFGGTPLFEGVDLQVEPQDRICLVGRNGSGKSTLMKIGAGLAEAQAGEVFRHPSATVRYLEQAPDFSGFKTVRDYAIDGLAPGDDPNRVDYLLQHLDVDGEADPQTLSGGEARRAALVRVLAPEPDILLLDEPTNHLDLPTIEWLESELQRFRGALVVISHDRRFLRTITKTTVWLDRGIARRLDKGFGAFEEWQDKVLEEEEQARHKLGRAIVREEHWLRYGVTARRKRNMRRLAELQDMRKRHRSHRGPLGTARMQASDARESGKLVIEAESVSKSYGNRSIVSDFSIRVHRGDRIGLVGPNGAGKTTLLNLLTGRTEPDSGTVRTGTNLEIATLDQRRTDLDPDMSLENFLTDGRGSTLIVNGEQRHVTGYMKDFLFQPEQSRTPVRELSGGEKARLLLARLLARPANLIILDEPTNDLDIETLDLLQELIAGFAGTVLLVSHDRDFLDRTVSSIIAPANMENPDGRWIVYAGGYSDMFAQRSDQSAETGVSTTGGKARPDDARKAARERKLSYKQTYALETLPGRIEAAQEKAAVLETRLADSQLFSRDPDTFTKTADELAGLRTSIERMEEEWLELEMLREEIETAVES